MKFLESIADRIISAQEDPADLQVIFPNRRAGLFLKSILQNRTDKPMWSPDIISFQDMIRRESVTYQPDQLRLIYELYQVYSKNIPSTAKEGFERFYYWGKMLLKDFDEIDRYMIDGSLLYRNLAYQKELDLQFDFLSDEQKELLQRFWQGFEESRSENKLRFLAIWERLGPIYSTYRETLLEKKMAYEGMQYRLLADTLETHQWQEPGGKILFAGFNALTKAEEVIISWFLEHRDAEIVWDLDAYYVNDEHQEAGRFFREYRNKARFANSFPASLPDSLRTVEKSLEIIGVPQYVGQARMAGQLVGELLRQQPDIDLRKIAIVLADESLLLPVLNALPSEADSVNVTMGFPLSNATVNSLLEYLVELQVFYREEKGYHYTALAGILRHPLILTADTDHLALLQWMQKNNQVYLAQKNVPVSMMMNKIFRPVGNDFLIYILDILDELLVSETLGKLNRTFVHFYRKQFGRYYDILQDYNERVFGVETFKRLFRQLSGAEKVPFTGEPLEGIQVMGVLETRNLDFDHVFLLSCNEGNLPSSGNQHSFLPYNVRKAYELPHNDQQDAIYAYLFYRLIQGADAVTFFWNTEGNDFGEEEMSRFLKQLIHEFPSHVSQRVLAHETAPTPNQKITMERTDGVRDRLSRYYTENDQDGISPSALYTYLECRLKFYYKYVARLFESVEVEEDLDARTLGSVLHLLMEDLYNEHLNRFGKMVRAGDLERLKKRMPVLINLAFRKHYKIQEGDPFEIEGKNLIAKEVVLKFAAKILDKDSAHLPFEILGNEEKITVLYPLSNGHYVKLTGMIDRIDRTREGIRIIDYKTGKDTRSFGGIEELFSHEKPQKLPFQLFLYTELYDLRHPGTDILIPAVYNKEVLFQGQDHRLKNSKGFIMDYRNWQPDFRKSLTGLLETVFFSTEPFDQTEDVKRCKLCPYNVICRRA